MATPVLEMPFQVGLLVYEDLLASSLSIDVHHDVVVAQEVKKIKIKINK